MRRIIYSFLLLFQVFFSRERTLAEFPLSLPTETEGMYLFFVS
jgi:hypothetical protein